MADNQSKEIFGQTPSQTVGPFFHYGLPWKGGADLTGQSDLGARTDLMPSEHYLLREAPERGSIPGTPVEIEGRIVDGAGAAIPDALIEIWQADSAGRYYTPDLRRNVPPEDIFIGFGRSSTGNDGEYRFRTILPGRVPGPRNVMQASHIAVGVFGRGLVKRLVTRLYFEGGEGLSEDPVLNLVPAERRDTLIAKRVGPLTYRFDIILQGDRETVFFDI